MKRFGFADLPLHRGRVPASSWIAWFGVAVLALFFDCFVLPAQADSDGYFCISKGYLAFELRSFHTPNLKAEHVLRVVRFDPGRGIYDAGEVALQDFEVHHMNCKDDRVEISGWDKGYIEYSIDIAVRNILQIAKHFQDPKRKFDPSKIKGPAPGNLGLSQPQTILLASDDPEHKYQLVLTRTEKPTKGGLENHRKAELLQIDSGGNVSQRIQLYEDHSVEYGD
jgi:hypothetical protein